MTVADIAVLIGAYLLGSVPFGLVLTRLAGLGDIRQIGSGNIGATNVLRTGRKDLALLTLLLDAGKGAIAVLLVRHFFDPGLAMFAGAVAFIGHCFPVFLRFQGGKGVATFFGTLIAMHPVIALFTVGCWLLTAVMFKMSSLAALLAAFVAPAVAHMIAPGMAPVFILFMSLVIFIRHKENIQRIAKGAEPKIGGSKSNSETSSKDTDTTPPQ
ncbi:glycerol-3-phosphate acyltransferase [Kordiimonas sediminis]|uniref:Glycerol-3-phosphate acyltransferase n=1 Tax=Kordiimonas sediminis TaxID=1735581 RepID=A0A919E782_9PROT|nr:glycerol-3-phosphate 1-O-acyltransferase PlsY [Kordiimonas sediminis]GHF25775.1 glycerol-3-phosphate acyltransferase [Kordiimonas sediminis]